MFNNFVIYHKKVKKNLLPTNNRLQQITSLGYPLTPCWETNALWVICRKVAGLVEIPGVGRGKVRNDHGRRHKGGWRGSRPSIQHGGEDNPLQFQVKFCIFSNIYQICSLLYVF